MHDFDWDERKARSNLAKHRVSFEAAKLVFEDTFAVELPVEVAVDGEERYTLIGMARLALLAVLYTERNGRVRIISARHATNQKKDSMSSKTATDGTDWERLRNMTDEEAYQNALSDHDNPPMTEEQLATMKRSSRARVIRRALGMTQEEFSAKFRIPLATLQDGEARRSEPDEASRAYLKVIASDPEMVLRALHPSAA